MGQSCSSKTMASLKAIAFQVGILNLIGPMCSHSRLGTKLAEQSLKCLPSLSSRTLLFELFLFQTKSNSFPMCHEQIPKTLSFDTREILDSKMSTHTNTPTAAIKLIDLDKAYALCENFKSLQHDYRLLEATFLDSNPDYAAAFEAHSLKSGNSFFDLEYRTKKLVRWAKKTDKLRGKGREVNLRLPRELKEAEALEQELYATGDNLNNLRIALENIGRFGYPQGSNFSFIGDRSATLNQSVNPNDTTKCSSNSLKPPITSSEFLIPSSMNGGESASRQEARQAGTSSTSTSPAQILRKISPSKQSKFLINTSNKKNLAKMIRKSSTAAPSSLDQVKFTSRANQSTPITKRRSSRRVMSRSQKIAHENPDADYGFPVTGSHFTPQEIWEQRYQEHPPGPNPTEYTRVLEEIVTKLKKRAELWEGTQPVKVLRKALAENIKVAGQNEKLRETNAKLREEKINLKREIQELKRTPRSTKAQVTVSEVEVEEVEEVEEEGEKGDKEWRKFNQSMNRKNIFMYPGGMRGGRIGVGAVDRFRGEKVAGMRDSEDSEDSGENERAGKRRRSS